MSSTGLTWTCTAGIFAMLFVGTAHATIPYTPVTAGTPSLGPGLIMPDKVPGKEYSHDLDENTTGLGGVLDPHQVIAWDGIGGAGDGLDFSPVLPTAFIGLDIDAIANHNDLLFTHLLSDDAHLLFSLDKDFLLYPPGGGPTPATIPSGPAVVLKNGNTVGGAGEISYELGVFGGANGSDIQGTWATQPMINGMPLPDDLDGLEVWGPEPGFTADTDKFSLRVDAATSIVGPPISVFNGDGSPYIDLPTIEAAVFSLLGPLTSTAQTDGLNLDALMVRDHNGSDMMFDRDPTGGGEGDMIIFSIDQVADPADPDGYYATGSEIFVLEAFGPAGFLAHGGHLWDHAYALATFSIGTPGTGQQNYGAFDLDALEAVTQDVVPEPASLSLMIAGALMLLRRRAV